MTAQTCIPSRPCGACDHCTGYTFSNNGDAPPPSPYRATRLADVTPEQVSWLWPGRLPRGKVVVLDGDPSVGKSTLALDLTARITTARAMPGEDLACVPASAVVLMAAEDGLADTIRPRLDAAGADPMLVHHFDAVTRVDDDGNVRTQPPTIPDDVAALEQLIVDTGAVLVIVDVLMAYLSGRADAHRDQDVRRALAQLADVADRTGACIILLRHLRKSRGSAIYSGGGSVGIIGVARAGLVAAVDPDDDSGDRRVLAVAKSNLAAMPPAHGYRLVDDEALHVAAVVWLGETAHTADRLMEISDSAERSDRQMANAWLTERLSGVGHVSRDLIVEARETADISEKTLRRAGKDLGVVAYQQGRQWWWKLPSDVSHGQHGVGHVRASDGGCGDEELFP